MIDAAMHIVRVERLGIPQDTREAFTLLETAGLLDSALADRLRRMVGFRHPSPHRPCRRRGPAGVRGPAAHALTTDDSQSSAVYSASHYPDFMDSTVALFSVGGLIVGLAGALWMGY